MFKRENQHQLKIKKDFSPSKNSPLVFTPKTKRDKSPKSHTNNEEHSDNRSISNKEKISVN